jgi:hypothetical protein
VGRKNSHTTRTDERGSRHEHRFDARLRRPAAPEVIAAKPTTAYLTVAALMVTRRWWLRRRWRAPARPDMAPAGNQKSASIGLVKVAHM